MRGALGLLVHPARNVGRQGPRREARALPPAALSRAPSVPACSQHPLVLLELLSPGAAWRPRGEHDPVCALCQHRQQVVPVVGREGVCEDDARACRGNAPEDGCAASRGLKARQSRERRLALFVCSVCVRARMCERACERVVASVRVCEHIGKRARAVQPHVGPAWTSRDTTCTAVAPMSACAAFRTAHVKERCPSASSRCWCRTSAPTKSTRSGRCAQTRFRKCQRALSMVQLSCGPAPGRLHLARPSADDTTARSPPTSSVQASDTACTLTYPPARTRSRRRHSACSRSGGDGANWCARRGCTPRIPVPRLGRRGQPGREERG